MVIAFLYSSDVLTKAQRVSRFWRDTILQSPSIQRNLQLRPEADEVVAPLGFTSTHMWPPPPADMSIFPDLPVYPPNIQENYLIPRRSLGLSRRYEGSTKGHPNHMIRLSQRSFALASNPDFRPTWMGLFLTVPPITVAYLELELAQSEDKEGNAIGYYCWSLASVRDPKGLTFETVLKAAEKIRQSAPADTIGRGNARVSVRYVVEPREGQCIVGLVRSLGLDPHTAIKQATP